MILVIFWIFIYLVCGLFVNACIRVWGTLEDPIILFKQMIEASVNVVLWPFVLVGYIIKKIKGSR